MRNRELRAALQAELRRLPHDGTNHRADRAVRRAQLGADVLRRHAPVPAVREGELVWRGLGLRNMPAGLRALLNVSNVKPVYHVTFRGTFSSTINRALNRPQHSAIRGAIYIACHQCANCVAVGFSDQRRTNHASNRVGAYRSADNTADDTITKHSPDPRPIVQPNVAPDHLPDRVHRPRRMGLPHLYPWVVGC